MGTLVIAPEYKDRATVLMDEQGSTLTIGIAKAEDRGLYKCSVAVRGDRPEIKHQVRIRGQSGHSQGINETIGFLWRLTATQVGTNLGCHIALF